MAAIHIESFEQLEAFLRNWKSFADTGEYDFNGMAALLEACLDNLQAHSLDVEIDEGNYFSDGQRAFLKRIAEKL